MKRLLGEVWRASPRFLRRLGVWLSQPRFTVTAGAVVCDENGRVLLLHHVFRKGSGWGIPGGFLAKGEQPEDALRRELREETGLSFDELELAFVRTLDSARQVEIIFRCRLKSDALNRKPESLEVDRAEWFERTAFPEGFSADQRLLIDRALGD